MKRKLNTIWAVIKPDGTVSSWATHRKHLKLGKWWTDRDWRIVCGELLLMTQDDGADKAMPRTGVFRNLRPEAQKTGRL